MNDLFYGMDKIVIPASITFESSNLNRKYKWKSDLTKQTVYKINSKRAFIRFSSKNFSNKLNKLNNWLRKIDVKFLNDKTAVVRRKENGKFSMQGYRGKHPYVQFIVNSALSPSLRERFIEKSQTFPVDIIFYLDDWADLNVLPSDFILDVEKEAKSLLNLALKNKFNIEKVSKGREFDVGLITPSGRKIVIAISSHIAKNKSRSKEKTIQKILMDICKMLPYLHENKGVTPIIVTRPIEFKNSWSFTTKKYLEFYKKEFGFRFLTTEFKNGWEDDILKELSKV